MAATPKGAQKIKLEYYIDREIYNIFIRKCNEKGYTPHVILEKLMKRYVETGQI